jgi:hypothetical protein
MKRVGNKKPSNQRATKDVHPRDLSTKSKAPSAEAVKIYAPVRAYFDGLAPGERPTTLGAMLFVIEHFAKRGIVLGNGGRPLGHCQGDPQEFLEQHRQLAMLTLMLGDELGLSTLFPDTVDDVPGADELLEG